MENQPDHLAGALEEVIDVGETVWAKNGHVLLPVDGTLQSQERKRLRREGGRANCVRAKRSDYSKSLSWAKSACPSGSLCRRARRRE